MWTVVIYLFLLFFPNIFQCGIMVDMSNCCLTQFCCFELRFNSFENGMFPYAKIALDTLWLSEKNKLQNLIVIECILCERKMIHSLGHIDCCCATCVKSFEKLYSVLGHG